MVWRVRIRLLIRGSIGTKSVWEQEVFHLQEESDFLKFSDKEHPEWRQDFKRVDESFV
jgi:hypothetical protein